MLLLIIAFSVVICLCVCVYVCVCVCVWEGGSGWQTFILDISAFFRLLYGWRGKKNLYFNLSRNLRTMHF